MRYAKESEHLCFVNIPRLCRDLDFEFITVRFVIQPGSTVRAVLQEIKICCYVLLFVPVIWFSFIPLPDGFQVIDTALLFHKCDRIFSFFPEQVGKSKQDEEG